MKLDRKEEMLKNQSSTDGQSIMYFKSRIRSITAGLLFSLLLVKPFNLIRTSTCRAFFCGHFQSSSLSLPFDHLSGDRFITEIMREKFLAAKNSLKFHPNRLRFPSHISFFHSRCFLRRLWRPAGKTEINNF